MTTRLSGEKGFSMLEILVALVISLVTLMGAAGLVFRTVQQEVDGVQRLQAMTLAQEMVDRININRQVASCYSNGANGLQLGKGVAAADIPDCTAGTPSQQDRAESDLAEWHSMILGAAVQTEKDSNIGAMIDARGCIAQENAVNRTYRVTVVWEGLSDTIEPSVPCGADLYSTKSRRRAISLIVQIGDLS